MITDFISQKRNCVDPAIECGCHANHIHSTGHSDSKGLQEFILKIPLSIGRISECPDKVSDVHPNTAPIHKLVKTATAHNLQGPSHKVKLVSLSLSSLDRPGTVRGKEGHKQLCVAPSARVPQT